MSPPFRRSHRSHRRPGAPGHNHPPHSFILCLPGKSAPRCFVHSSHRIGHRQSRWVSSSEQRRRALILFTCIEPPCCVGLCFFSYAEALSRRSWAGKTISDLRKKPSRVTTLDKDRRARLLVCLKPAVQTLVRLAAWCTNRRMRNPRPWRPALSPLSPLKRTALG